MAFVLEKAAKEQAKARWVIEGPAGSGKTFTSLSVASGLGDTIAVIDTVRRQSLVFADRFNFDVLHMADNFHPEQLIEALGVCCAFDTTIIDTFTSFWSGPLGMLAQVDLLSDGRPGSSFNNGWKEMRPIEQKMIDAILAHPGHVIMTVRVKTDYQSQQGADGKWAPKKIGLKPDQREGLDYEMGIVTAIDMSHTLTFTKSPYAGFDGRVVERPTEELGLEYRRWLEDGKAPVTVWQLRDLVLEAREIDELRELRARALYLNKWNAPITDEHGEPSTLGDIMTRLLRDMIAAQKAVVK
jgi:hypothetical protein